MEGAQIGCFGVGLRMHSRQILVPESRHVYDDIFQGQP